MTTMLEPEWDQATRDLVLALDDVDMCTVCGGPTYLCQDPDRQFDWEVPPPVRCHRRTALREFQARFNEESNPHTEALSWRVGLRTRST